MLVVISKKSRNLPKRILAVQMSSSLLTSPISDTQRGTQRIAQEPFNIRHAIFLVD